LSLSICTLLFIVLFILPDNAGNNPPATDHAIGTTRYAGRVN